MAQLVEHHLAKVRVAGSNPVVRSRTSKAPFLGAFFFVLLPKNLSRCYAGSDVKRRNDGSAMNTKTVACETCGQAATQFEGKLPTTGVAKVLVAGIIVYIAGIWVLVALAFATTGDTADRGLMEMLVVLSAVVSLLTVLVLYWMFRPKKGTAVICPHCGARYAVTLPPNYSKGWNYDKLAQTAAALPSGNDEGN